MRYERPNITIVEAKAELFAVSGGPGVAYIGVDFKLL